MNDRELKTALLSLDALPKEAVQDTEAGRLEAARVLRLEEVRLHRLRRTTAIVWIIIAVLPVLAILLGISLPILARVLPVRLHGVLGVVLFALSVFPAVLILYGLVCGVRLYFASRSLTLARITTSLTGIESLLRQQLAAKEPPSRQLPPTSGKPSDS
jgi:hypothetical protein